MPSTYDAVIGTQRGHDFNTFSVRQVDPRIHLLQSDVAPILTTLMNLRRGDRVTQVKVEWPEDEMLPHTTLINNGAGYNTTALTFVVDNEEYGNVGAYALVQRTREIMGPITSKDSGASTFTVQKRGAFGTTPADIVDNDPIIFIRGNIKEGGDAASMIMTLPVMKFNYIEPTSTTYGVTEIFEDTQVYADVNKLRTLSAKKMKEHMEEIEKKILYGIRGIDTTSDTGVRYSMGGLFHYITTTIETISVGSGGTKQFSLKDWNRFMRRLFAHNQSSARKVVFASGEIIEQFDDFKLQMLELRPDDPMIDIATKSYRNSFGIVDFVHHRFLNSSFGTDWYAIALDLSKVEYRPFQPQIVKTGIQDKRSHKIENEIYQSDTIQIMNEPVHGIFRVIE